MEDFGALVSVWKELRSNVYLLGLSGVAGACIRVLFAPEGQMKRRMVQGLGGAVAAVFLGGPLAHIINIISDSGAYAFLASGFLMGNGGELAIRAMQDRFFGRSDQSNNNGIKSS